MESQQAGTKRSKLEHMLGASAAEFLPNLNGRLQPPDAMSHFEEVFFQITKINFYCC